MTDSKLKLTVIRGGPHARTEFLLVRLVTTIGRSHKNTVVLNDHKVSRYHAEIARSSDGFIVRDLDSANGVKVNGSKVQSSALVPTDVVTIGDTDFRVDAVSFAELNTLVSQAVEAPGDIAEALEQFRATTPPPDRAPLAPQFPAPAPAASASAVPKGQNLLVMPPASHGEAPAGPKLIELIPAPAARIEIAGLDNLVGWIARRAPLAEGGPGAASGIGVVGPAGCGKSTIARFTAARWSRPCFRLHLPYLVLYQPAQWPEKLAAALEQAAAHGPAVLAIEDVDRAGERFESLGADLARGWLLASELLAHWVKTKPPSPFAIITARDPARAHPALFTPGGSLDEVFAIDLPSPRERQLAFEIALRARGRTSDALDPRALCDATAGFTVAQIQAGVTEALLRLGASPRELATAQLLDAFATMTPSAESAADAEVRRRNVASFRAATGPQL